MTAQWNDLTRPPLRGVDLNRDLSGDGWRIEVLDQIDSTQRAVALAAAQGAHAGLVVVAEYQGAGRGRRDRTWVSPPRAGVTMSILLRPRNPSPWMGIALSLAAVNVVNDMAAMQQRDVEAALKWPNDLMLNGRKFGGIIAEVDRDALIVGIGINVSTKQQELPVENATSLALEGLEIDRSTLIKATLRGFTVLERLSHDELHACYVERLETIGQLVRIDGINGSVEGIAEGIDADGHLIVDGRSWSVGDVVHLR